MKHIRAALSLGAACAMVHTGIAIYRYPAHAAVVFAILTVFSLIGGASAWEVPMQLLRLLSSSG
jgi:hypothetical protein